MKLYLISQSINNTWDTYDSAVVCAENEEQAKLIHPGSIGRYDDHYKDWHNPSNPENYWLLRDWTDPAYVRCRYLGEAHPGLTPGPVCSSFNAG